MLVAFDWDEAFTALEVEQARRDAARLQRDLDLQIRAGHLRGGRARPRVIAVLADALVATA